MIIEIDITDLIVGNYLVRIGKQKGKFKLKSAATIKSTNVISSLIAKGVDTVFIDTSKMQSIEQVANSKELITDEPENPAQSARQKVNEDIKQAKEIFNESKDIQQQLFSDALSGKEIDLEPVNNITSKTIETIFENPDALACIINIRQKDAYLLEHSVAVSVLITIFGRYLELDKELIHQLSVGAFLHDVGKIMIPDEILNKPGKLTDGEFMVMKSHVTHSMNIIENTPDISPLSLEVAALHHEKLDGNGYPYRVKADKISKYGRMISICDIFDALTANRCYKQGYSHTKSFSILRNLAQQNHLDAELVDQFIRCMGVYPVGTLVELGSNRLAIVDSRNQADPTKPIVRSFYNAEEHEYVESEDIDLSIEDDYIVKGVRPDDFDLDMNQIVEFLLMDG